MITQLKTLTFTVEDALLSPIGFSILSGANLFDYDDQPVHVNRVIRTGVQGSGSYTTQSYDKLYQKTEVQGVWNYVDNTTSGSGSQIDEQEIAAVVAYYGDNARLWASSENAPGAAEAAAPNSPLYYYTLSESRTTATGCTIDLSDQLSTPICSTAPIFVSIIREDSVTGDFLAVTSVSDRTIVTENTIYRYNDQGMKVSTGETITTDNAYKYVVLVDCYTKESNEAKAMELQIDAENFAGYFYVEADTLVRRQSDGRDLPAILTIPLVKIQSNFTITMASSGDPSTFTFTMDAMPGYTYFNNKKKVLCTFQVIDEITGTTTIRDAVMRENKDGSNQTYVHKGFYPNPSTGTYKPQIDDYRGEN